MNNLNENLSHTDTHTHKEKNQWNKFTKRAMNEYNLTIWFELSMI